MAWCYTDISRKAPGMHCKRRPAHNVRNVSCVLERRHPRDTLSSTSIAVSVRLPFYQHSCQTALYVHLKHRYTIHPLPGTGGPSAMSDEPHQRHRGRGVGGLFARLGTRRGAIFALRASLVGSIIFIYLCSSIHLPGFGILPSSAKPLSSPQVLQQLHGSERVHVRTALPEPSNR